MMRSRRLPPLRAPAALPPLTGEAMLLAAILLLGHALPLQAGEPRILTVRPEKIEAVLGQKTASPPLGRDPFNWSREQISFFKSREPREKSNSIGGLALSGIIWDKNTPQAVINDRLVTKGETIGDAVVRQILKDLVVVEQNGVSHELWLESSPRPLPIKDKKH
ncbi:MAG: hypothetical protein V1782_10835 [Pseudomonadota bacterium]